MTPFSKVLIFLDYYYPGVKGGGPITTIQNLVQRLAGRYDFYIVTDDRDYGDTERYKNVSPFKWTKTPFGRVFFRPRKSASIRLSARLIQEVDPQVVYVNSAWSRRSTLFPLFARRLVRPDIPTIIAPRGEFAPGALALKPRRKRIYAKLLSMTGLMDDAIWQATSDFEAQDIRDFVGGRADIIVAPNLGRPIPKSPKHTRKKKGELRLAFAGRISRMKNIDFAIQILAQLEGKVEFSIYGPLEDKSYGKECSKIAESLPSNIKLFWSGVVDYSFLYEILAQADALFLPSAGENFGHAIWESLAAGTPVVISDRTPWRSLEMNGAGWDLPLEQPDIFVRVLQHLIDLNAEEHHCLRASTRLFAERIAAEDWRLKSNIDLLEAAGGHNQYDNATVAY